MTTNGSYNRGEIYDSLLTLLNYRSKLYSVKLQNCRKTASAGVRRSIAAKELSHDDYKAALFDNVGKTIEQRSIRSRNHKLFTVEEKKAALSSIDTKRFMLPDRVHTRALGHYRNDVL